MRKWNSANTTGTFGIMRYPLTDGGEGYSASQPHVPETMLGDTAVAVHPDDERYSKATSGKQ